MSIYIIILSVAHCCTSFSPGSFNVGSAPATNAFYSSPCQESAETKVSFTRNEAEAGRGLEAGAEVYRFEIINGFSTIRVKKLERKASYSVEETEVRPQ